LEKQTSQWLVKATFFPLEHDQTHTEIAEANWMSLIYRLIREPCLLTREGQQKQATEKGKRLHRKRMGIVNDQMLGTHKDYLMLLAKLHNCVPSTEKQRIKRPNSLCFFVHNQFNASRSTS